MEADDDIDLNINNICCKKSGTPSNRRTVQLFIGELHNLLDHLDIRGSYALLGQSRRVVLTSAFAAQQPVGSKKLIIADSSASMQLWMTAAAQLRLKSPQDAQDALNKHEAAGTTDDEAYKQATRVFYKHFLCRKIPMAEPLRTSFG